MTSKREKRLRIGVLLVSLATAAIGVRIRTRTGWQTPVTVESTWVNEPLGEIQLRLNLTDKRDGTQRKYNWWFRRTSAMSSPATVTVDCGEFKSLRFWNNETGIVWYGQRFKKSVVLGNSESGERGVYRYEISWRTQTPAPQPIPVVKI